MKEDATKREGYDKTRIVGDIYPDAEYPGCPYSGEKYFVICDCGKLNCMTGIVNHQFQCEWCESTGKISDYDGFGFESGGDR